MTAGPFPGTTITGPLVSGNQIGGVGSDTGFAQLIQSYQIATAGVGATTTVVPLMTAFLPPFSQIVDFKIDVVTAAANATAFVSVGSPTNNTFYMNAVVIGAAGRVAQNATTLNLAHNFDIGTGNPSVPVVLYVTAQTTTVTGNVIWSILYDQTTRSS